MELHYWILWPFLVVLACGSIVVVLQKKMQATVKGALLGILTGGGLLIANAFPKAPEVFLWVGAILMLAGIVGLVLIMDPFN